MAKFLFKANDDVLSHCRCRGVPASSTAQADCPWCGCGWLISCSHCLKAFTFAEIRETEVPMVELGRREAAGRGMGDMAEADIEAWAKDMEEAIAGFSVGEIVVYLDGTYFAIDERNIHFDGYYAHHDLIELPHVRALNAPSLLDAVLGDKLYWLDRELPNRR